jgi:hypothetical protein
LLRLFANDNAGEDVVAGVRCVDVKRGGAENHSVECVFMDAFGHFVATYGGGNGEYVLVRPDGYVGWIGSGEDLADLKDYPGLENGTESDSSASRQ